ncbi:hypothetical protein [Nonomuraea sp. B19D2]|uniref:acyl-CoA-like ligand-binding transcription factor n=1 Tax=Nonomuraea sp. B19D2 TaxID=3159561 RepID=UPI0032DA4966
MIMSTPELEGEALKAFTMAEGPLTEAIAARTGADPARDLSAAVAGAIRVAGRHWLEPGNTDSFATVLRRALSRVFPATPSEARLLPLDPTRQLIGSQCSGALVLDHLGLLAGRPACTDTTTRPWLEERGVTVLDAPFHAEGAIATAGGCLASVYLAAWTLLHTVGEAAARAAIDYAAPVGEKEEVVQRVMSTVGAVEAALR